MPDQQEKLPEAPKQPRPGEVITRSMALAIVQAADSHMEIAEFIEQISQQAFEVNQQSERFRESVTQLNEQLAVARAQQAFNNGWAARVRETDPPLKDAAAAEQAVVDFAKAILAKHGASTADQRATTRSQS